LGGKNCVYFLFFRVLLKTGLFQNTGRVLEQAKQLIMSREECLLAGDGPFVCGTGGINCKEK
jgi:hypothetical protein